MRPAGKLDSKDLLPVPGEEPVGATAQAGFKPWLPALAAMVMAPLLTYALVELVLVPRLQAKLGADTGALAAPGVPSANKPRETPEASSFDYKDIVVNLAGTMGTRYLKTSFVVTGKGVRGVFEADKARLADVTLGFLSSITLADLEQAGARNVLRSKLVNAYNQTLGKHVVDQVYFSDFVIQ